MARVVMLVPQGSVLRSLLFNVFLCDFFYFKGTNIVSYTDDVNLAQELVISKLEETSLSDKIPKKVKITS